MIYLSEKAYMNLLCEGKRGDKGGNAGIGTPQPYKNVRLYCSILGKDNEFEMYVRGGRGEKWDGKVTSHGTVLGTKYSCRTKI